MPGADWKTKVLNDLAKLKDAISANAPLERLSKTTHYAIWLNEGYEAALQLAEQVQTEADYMRVLQFYITGFHDFHTQYDAIDLMTGQVALWPGFVVALRYDAEENKDYYEVVHAMDCANVPPVGARLLSCDGQLIEEALKKYVLPYYYYKKEFPVTQSNIVSNLFLQQAGQCSWLPSIKNCEFRYKGEVLSYDLNWMPIPVPEHPNPFKNNFALWTNAAFGSTPEFSIKPFGNNSVWIRIPTFNGTPNDDQGKWLTKIAQETSIYKNCENIVFDLRGNNGGIPHYLNEIIKNLYTLEYLKSLEGFVWNQDFSMQMRATPFNLKVLKNYSAP